MSIKDDSKNVIKELQAFLCGKLAVCNKTNAVFPVYMHIAHRPHCTTADLYYVFPRSYET